MKVNCPHHAPARSMYYPEVCKWWKPASYNCFGFYPGHCSHPEVSQAGCFAGKLRRDDE